MSTNHVIALAEARKLKPPIPLAVNSSQTMVDNMNILLVEDNFADSILIQKELSHAFRGGDYHLQGVRTQSQALALLDEREFDVVLLDLTLPDSSGLETLTRLQMDFPHMPVIVLTGYEDENFALEAVGNGAQDYLIKSKVNGQAIKRALQYALQRKRLELDLREARQQAEKANRAKSEFLTMMSHELRTPLNAISGFTQLMMMNEDKSFSERNMDYLQSVLSASDHLLTLVNDILELAKTDARKFDIKSETVDVDHLLSELQHYILPLARQKDIEVKITGEKDFSIMGDYTRLLQVLLNLASNAVKYNRDHGQIEVKVEKHDHAARITVTDTGYGIPESRHAELFQPFNRLGAENSPVQGTGVGLAICHNLIYEMNGSINFSSAEGKGSSFWIEMPLADTGPSAVANAAPEFPPLVLARQPKILYVEDNVINTNLIRSILENFFKAEVLIAHSVAEGVALAKTQIPDLVISDIHFSEMTGFDLLQQLKSDPRTHAVPAFALTADTTKATLEKIRDAGFQQTFTKPFNIKEMQDAVQAVLANSAIGSINHDFKLM